MSSLAAVADLEARLGRTFTGTEIDRAQALLDDASAKVRSYTGQDINAASTTVRLRVRNGRATLPQRPVTAITSVADQNAIAITNYQRRNEVLYFGSVLLNEWEIEPRRLAIKLVDVNYTHGFAADAIPEVIIAIVCQVAGRAFGVPSTDSGITSTSLGSYSEATGSAAGAGPVGLLAEEKIELDRFVRDLGLASYAS